MTPALAHLDAVAADLNATGIRAEESAARAKMVEREPLTLPSGRVIEQWRPLLAWKFDDVVAIHHRHGVRPNPEYFDGAERVGCHPCIFARKDEVRRIAERDPRRIEMIRRLEAVVLERARARTAARARRNVDRIRFGPSLGVPRFGVHPPRLHHIGNEEPYEIAYESAIPFEPPAKFDPALRNPPSWFQAPSLREERVVIRDGRRVVIRDGRRVVIRDGSCWPIDRVVEWSKTSRGGRQVELFALPESEAGCMRWGFCETAKGAA